MSAESHPQQRNIAADAANELVARLASSTLPRILFIGHALGGGVHRHMRDLAGLVAGDCHVLTARPGPGATVEISAADATTSFAAYFALPAEMLSLIDLLRGLGISRIHVHHLHGMPRAVLEALDALQVPYDVTLHDYYGLHPGRDGSLALADPADASPSGSDEAIAPGAVPWDLSLTEWRQSFAKLLVGASRVIAPSQDVASRYRSFWPQLRVSVHPHPEWPRSPLRRIVRAIAPGRMSPEKGLHVLVACALDARERDLGLYFRVLGCTTEPVAQSPYVPLSVSGEYPEAALPGLIAAERPDVILLPTQVPETYGYILSTAIASGLPIVASSLGAYVERLAGYDACRMLPHDAAPAAWNAACLELAGVNGHELLTRTAMDLQPGTSPEAYRRWYVAAIAPPPRSSGDVPRIDPRHLELPRADVGAEGTPLAALFVAGVECGQAESRTELKHRIDEIAVERMAAHEERDLALREQQRAQARADEAEHALRLAHARIREFETSTSWRLTSPVRMLGRPWKLTLARLRASYAAARHVPRQADIARTIWRDHGTAALATRVWNRLSGRRRYRPPVVTRYLQETAVGPLTFPKLGVSLPRVSIIIPAFGDPLLTYTCLKSILANTPGGRYEVIVIDDASDVPLAGVLHDVRGVRIERNETNQGFVANCNLGASLARGEVLLFLNNDTIVTPGWLQAILQIFERRTGVGLVGVKLVYPDGRLQEAGGIVWRDGSAWNCGRGDDPERPEHNYVREVDYCSGACVAVPSAVFRAVGGFDMRFAPAYYEDTDLAFAVRAAGRRVVYQPRATVVHFEGQTSGTDTLSGVKRHQVINQHRFAEKWSLALAGHRNNGIDAHLEHDRFARHRVLVIDACMLTPDQDSGSVRMQAILELLIELHCKVTFVADSLEYREPYVSDLQQRGVEVLFHPYVRSIPVLLGERGRKFDIVLLSRHYIAAKHVGTVRAFAPQALLVFDTVDLHFLRAERLAELDGGAMAKAGARAKRDEELALIRKADFTLVVSHVEKTLLASMVPEADVAILSNVHELLPGSRPFAERQGLVFIGGFQHPPNTDAVLWYASEVLPHVRRLIPGAKTYIVGADAPGTIRDLAADDFIITGHVPDVGPFFTSTRASISPLRYGAGVKGKVNLAMSYGLPVVATTPSVEGMHLTPEVDVLIADSAEAFAAAIARVYL
ncbi:MAG: glycosyltransferase, partial [Pseudomonadota bacterium]|nr:glycosyltransferase [Pseudomonadota bacterium]